jgi:predicted glycoside hydrolase/deacetylase ChbG (UPF0249 family)
MPLTTPEIARLHGFGEGVVDNVAAFLAPMLTAASDVPHPDHFEAGFYGETATLDSLCSILDALPEGVTEVMSHPGLPDEALTATSSYNRQRGQELEALTSAAARTKAA